MLHSFIHSFKSRKSQPGLDQDQRAHKARYKHSLNQFAIDAGARAPEGVIRAANSQSQGTWRASAKRQFDSLLARVSAIYFSAED